MLSKVFKEAHKMTRELVRKYKVNYQAQFSLCLSYLLNREEKEMIDVKKLEEMILKKDNTKTEVTINEWEKYDKHRVYINVKVKNRRRSVTSYIDLDTDEIITKNNDSYKDWIMSLVEAVDEIVKEYKEEIIELAVNKKEEKTEVKKDNNKVDLHAEFLGLDNNLSSEDFEDITGLKKFDESYF